MFYSTFSLKDKVCSPRPRVGKVDVTHSLQYHKNSLDQVSYMPKKLNSGLLGSGQKNCPQKSSFFIFYPFRAKKKSLWVESKYTRLDLFFTAGQSYAWVGSGQGEAKPLG